MMIHERKVNKEKMKDYLKYVNPLQGTDSVFTRSHGNTLPLVGKPFAMTSWTLQTSESPWMFHPGECKLQGFRATRQPSPWMKDYGHFVVMPQVCELFTSAEDRSSSYDIEQSIIKPDYMKVFLERYETAVELTATERCCFMQIKFPKLKQSKRMILDVFQGKSNINISSNEDSGTISGFTCASSGRVHSSFACYFVIEFDCSIKIDKSGLFHDDAVINQASGEGEQLGAFVELNATDKPVAIRIGTSFISIEQARRNLSLEIGDNSFDETRLAVADAWNKMLGRIDIEPIVDEDLYTFYSCLYRAFLFPRKWYEYNENMKPMHYSPYDGTIHAGVFYAENGFWDTHRTVYPLLSIIAPEELTEILNGWIAHYKESGWLPKWSNPGESGIMIGTHIDAVIADAVTKNITGFDVESAFEGMMKHAMHKAPSDNQGRLGINEYLKLGFVPDDCAEHSVSRTLDFAYGDFCIGQVASSLGKKKEAELMYNRSLNYRNVFDSNVDFMRGRNSDGKFIEPFDEFEWGGPYVEGSVWQCGWEVPHDSKGLMELMGGQESFLDKLDKMLSLPPTFRVGAYGKEIHEMTEMAAVDFGQYAHSNQPVHHVLYLFAVAGRPDKTQYWVRRVLKDLYGSGTKGFAGDEDNGEMASWFVLSALGIYPLCPGNPSYIFGSPMVKKATVHLQSGKDLKIVANNNSQDNLYVSDITHNDCLINDIKISHADLMSGGVLNFDMIGDPV
jgi:predicted alpha-1,2-mannosidase